ncbi:MAG: histidinol-phosphate transaminase [bacterium]
MIKILDRIKNLRPYKAGKPISELAREKNLKKIIKLASNENPLGPSPKAVEAIKENIWNLHRYVDPSANEMVTAISKKYNIQPQHIICGNGTDSLIADIVAAFSDPGDEVLTSEGSFIGIYVSANKQGRILTQVSLKDYAYDLNAISNAISEKTKVVFLANPNNPTGTMFTGTEFELFMQKIPDSVLVILDEAYEAYAREFDDYPVGVNYWYDNLLVTRTLSKVYGLGGLRIGYTVGPEYLISALAKYKLPFEPNCLAQVAAVAALNDDEFLNETVATNRRSLKVMRDKFDTLGIAYVESATNFLLMLMPSESFAEGFNNNCLNKGLIVRHVEPFGVPNGIRINSGTDEETKLALEIIEEVYTKMAASTPQGKPKAPVS